jgi:hypothetical protein
MQLGELAGLSVTTVIQRRSHLGTLQAPEAKLLQQSPLDGILFYGSSLLSARSLGHDSQGGEQTPQHTTVLGPVAVTATSLGQTSACLKGIREGHLPSPELGLWHPFHELWGKFHPHSATPGMQPPVHQIQHHLHSTGRNQGRSSL